MSAFSLTAVPFLPQLVPLNLGGLEGYDKVGRRACGKHQSAVQYIQPASALIGCAAPVPSASDGELLALIGDGCSLKRVREHSLPEIRRKRIHKNISRGVFHVGNFTFRSYSTVVHAVNSGDGPGGVLRDFHSGVVIS